eukprot:TRINITY_DN2729_c0_g1_i1.p1 TRINITY_DN2729_c0_g1~~TRINITY_DN2729_c0_g1_i1.p1  ORF type:complete len:374 (-),score=116.90 TRINITY_DN2729_c0_g1_i1:442-1563(-)
MSRLKALLSHKKENIGSIATYSSNYNSHAHSFDDVVHESGGSMEVDYLQQSKKPKRSNSEGNLLGKNKKTTGGIRPSRSSTELSKIADESPSSSSTSSTNNKRLSGRFSNIFSKSKSNAKADSQQDNNKKLERTGSSKQLTRRDSSKKLERTTSSKSVSSPSTQPPLDPEEEDRLALRRRYEEQLKESVSDEDEEENQVDEEEEEEDEEFFAKHNAMGSGGKGKGSSIFSKAKKNLAERFATSTIGKAILNKLIDDRGRQVLDAIKNILTNVHSAQEAENTERNATRLAIKYYFLYERGLLGVADKEENMSNVSKGKSQTTLTDNEAKKLAISKLANPLKEAAKALWSLNCNCTQIRTHPDAIQSSRNKLAEQ